MLTRGEGSGIEFKQRLPESDSEGGAIVSADPNLQSYGVPLVW
jgi:hypothetical protein